MRVRGFLCGGEETVLCAEDDEITASLAGFNVALIAKQFVGVLNCDEAQAGIGRQRTFRRQFAVQWKCAADNVIFDLFIELKIGRFRAFFANDVRHLDI